MIKRWCRIVISGVILVSSVLVYNIFAQEHSAKAIMDKVFTRYDGDDSYSEVEMVLLDKKGYERKRQLEIYTKDYGKLIKTYIKFTEPADIRGTAFLSIENEGKDNTQYLYLPALGRARRIVSSQKKLRFVNTDYTYEDMQRRRPEDDKHMFLREEACGQGETCAVIESVPKNNSQYTKRINWVDRNKELILRTDFYGRNGRMIKRFKVLSMKKIDNIWTAVDVIMEDFTNNHKTELKIESISYNQGISDEMFSLRVLEKD
ncbi:MAG: hypothetical protein B1H08_01810 [Candidatus Omnitrophica bacterium 4484_171]|nr:MAG: hypothetical protein B1H08_01810 [Candidatus Omnitrophica bacterium 4484_171]